MALPDARMFSRQSSGASGAPFIHPFEADPLNTLSEVLLKLHTDQKATVHADPMATVHVDQKATVHADQKAMQDAAAVTLGPTASASHADSARSWSRDSWSAPAGLPCESRDKLKPSFQCEGLSFQCEGLSL